MTNETQCICGHEFKKHFKSVEKGKDYCVVKTGDSHDDCPCKKFTPQSPETKPQEMKGALKDAVNSKTLIVEDKTRDNIFDVTDLDKKLKEKFKEEYHNHKSIKVILDKDYSDFLEGDDFNRNCDTCLEIQELYAMKKENQRLGDIVKRDWIEKAEVEKVLDEFEKYHFEEGSDHPSMTIHYSDFKELKNKLGVNGKFTSLTRRRKPSSEGLGK